MCGIVGYIGRRNAVEIALKGLKLLEYRGYDSAGIASCDARGVVFLEKSPGKIASLERKLKHIPPSILAIAHTRWATHGEPNFENAHPHADCKNEIFIAHNGIIENHETIRAALTQEGHLFRSRTDSEVVAHLIERERAGASTLEEAVMRALAHVEGTFGLAVLSAREPRKLIGARRGSPLLVGLGKKEYLLASDAAAIVGRTRRVIYLDDNEMAVFTPSSKKILAISQSASAAHREVEKTVRTIDWTVEDSQKGGFGSFMEKEIFEAPFVIENALRGHVLAKAGEVKFGGLDMMRDRLSQINRVIFVGCGTSHYASLVGKYFFEKFARLPAESVLASEFRYQPPVMDSKTAVFAISQSGETADTLEAVREAKRRGALTLGIVNVVGSSIAREVQAGVYNHAGPEIAVASTKAFISQLCVLALSAIYFGRLRKTLPASEASGILSELLSYPARARRLLTDARSSVEQAAEAYHTAEHFFYLGRRFNWPVALEGALKLKEISYIHAEGYAAGEMKHGPLALVNAGFPAFVVIPHDSVYEKTVSNIHELKARGAKIIALATEGDDGIAKLADHVIPLPALREELSPILSVIPLQLFAHQAAVLRGRDVDRPRNLAKSVTVE
ncbi:MAG: glutamine--fructose-6-phosphate transaminase (isomerizing) [Candidatus Niyogibacteria bacterium]|nr:glutamine--fructose-6-phosphate transaminase (isomerizing) [Candidatus Niyogibacteria bacterium]